MNRRRILGRRIVDIEQSVFFDRYTRTRSVSLSSITLDNGTKIIFHASPGEDVDEAYVSVTLITKSGEHIK
jgi:hypothetical protein